MSATSIGFPASAKAPAWVSGCGQVRVFPRNAVLILEGAPADAFHVVLSGRVKQFVYLAGHERQLPELVAGDSFGEAIFGGGRYHATIRTATRCEIQIISKGEIEVRLCSDAQFARGVIGQFAVQIGRLKHHLMALAHQSVEERIRECLIDFADQQHQHGRSGQRNQREIAACVGASPSMVSRVLKELAAQSGLVPRSGEEGLARLGSSS